MGIVGLLGHHWLLHTHWLLLLVSCDPVVLHDSLSNVLGHHPVGSHRLDWLHLHGLWLVIWVMRLHLHWLDRCIGPHWRWDGSLYDAL